MANELSGKKVAILVENGFEQVELTEPREALDQAGAETYVISPAGDTVRAWNFTNWGEEIPVDASLSQATAQQYDALLLPGGVMNPDVLRTNLAALDFVSTFFELGKPVAVICHGPWTLIDAGVVKGRRMTSWPSLITDLENAGAEWVDQEVVVDQGLVSSRSPDDIPAFNAKMIEKFAEGGHQSRATA